LLKFYRELIRLRKKTVALNTVDGNNKTVEGFAKERVIVVHRWRGEERALLIANLGVAEAVVCLSIPGGDWRNVVDSASETWRGKGSLLPRDFRAAAEIHFRLMPRSFALFVRETFA